MIIYMELVKDIYVVNEVRMALLRTRVGEVLSRGSGNGYGFMGLLLLWFGLDF